MNRIFAAFLLIAFATGAGRELTGTPGVMMAMSKAVIDASRAAVELALGLVGVMAFFLGLMKIAEQGGLLTGIARLIAPLMRRLFPEVPPQHPAMGAMIMNFSANLLGLGNAATPFGIRAMQELDRLNPHPGTATDAMVRFLAINTSGLALLPTGVIALRAAAGSSDPAAILPTTLFATTCATLVAVFCTPLFARFFPAPRLVPAPTLQPEQAQAEEAALAPLPRWVSWAAALSFVALIAASVRYGQIVSAWIVPSLIVAFIVYGLARGVAVYESFVDGAKDGFQVALRIIPYLVAILAATALLRASGALPFFVALLAPITEPLGLPAEVLPMALLRPLSGSGAFALLADLLKDPSVGPDSYAGWLASTLQGSTETTFYVLAVYFGAVGIKKMRHAIAAGLTADLAGVAAAVFICSWLYPGAA
ncbi:MAG: spore maturation protein [Rhodocyclales bacterium]|nr:spore maturation protein [Rhodocyclales bacterium]